MNSVNEHSIFHLSQKAAILAKYLLLGLLIIQLTSCDQPQSSNGQAQSKSVNEITTGEDAGVPSLYNVAISVSPGKPAVLGSVIPYGATIKNQGIETDTYVITTTSSLGWANLSQVPHSVTLKGGTNTTFTITVSVPLTASVGTEEQTFIEAEGKNGDDVTIHTLVHR